MQTPIPMVSTTMRGSEYEPNVSLFPLEKLQGYRGRPELSKGGRVIRLPDFNNSTQTTPNFGDFSQGKSCNYYKTTSPAVLA